jgi:cation transport ATPase
MGDFAPQVKAAIATVGADSASLRGMSRRRALLLIVLLLGLGAAVLAGLGHHAAARLAWDAAAVAVAADLLMAAARALAGGAVGVDVIALLAITTAIVMDESFTAALIALMVAGGGALEDFAEGRARREMTALLARAPRIAHRQDGERLADIAVDAIRPGDLLLVKPGEMLPVDGVLEGMAALLDESALTGEPLPVGRAPPRPPRTAPMPRSSGWSAPPGPSARRWRGSPTDGRLASWP